MLDVLTSLGDHFMEKMAPARRSLRASGPEVRVWRRVESARAPPLTRAALPRRRAEPVGPGGDRRRRRNGGAVRRVLQVHGQ